jgi:DNA mismatch repair protein MutS2
MHEQERLEYAKVLALLAGHCRSDCARRAAEGLSPYGDREQALKELARLEELSRALEGGLEARFEPAGDTRPLLARARVPGSMLEKDELDAVRANILSYQLLRRRLQPFRGELPGVWEALFIRPAPHGLLDRIDRVIDRKGEIRENASPRLAELSEELHRTREGIEEALEGYLRSPGLKQALRERQITLKDDRYVIPVKQSFKGRVPGVVHASSGTERTVFVEPFSVVERNNRLRVLRQEREREVRRLLKGLTAEVGRGSDALEAVQDSLVRFELLEARLGFQERYGCCIPRFSDSREVDLRGARHPLIRERAVPVDFRVGPHVHGVVITGPNTGGKTVTLKTVGLFVLLAQTGIPVPAEKMTCFFFSSVFADIGDEGSIEQSLSTFSGHITNIRRILREAGPGSLVLIDELGAGTDPLEGGPLGAAILEWLVDRGILTVVTTHFSFIKLFALEHDRIQVASTEFDPRTCLPTYRLVMGIPGRSNALEIARHLGLREEILARTRGFLREEDRSLDHIFKRLAVMERDLAGRGERLAEAENRLQGMLAEYREKLERLRRREQTDRARMQRDVSLLLGEYRSRLENSIREIREAQASRESVDETRGLLQDLEREFDEAMREEPAAGEAEAEEGGLRPGDRVEIQQAGTVTRGRVIEAGGGEVSVQAGSFRMQVPRERVRLLERAGEQRAEGTWEVAPAAEGGSELDIRGMRYEEAMQAVAAFLDRAVLGNRETVYIIHGLGTGALRQGVRDLLRGFAHAAHVAYAHPDQGGYGCTVVKLK